MGLMDKAKQLKQLNEMRVQAKKMQKALADEKVEVEESGIKVVLTGDMKIEEITIDGEEEKRVVNVLNKAMKKAQKLAAKKMQEMSGGLGGLLKGLGS